MRKPILILGLALAVMSLVAVCEKPKEKADDPVLQTTCPVMGGEIDMDIYAEDQGKLVYFYCAACIEEFEKDPGKYIKALEDKGINLEKTSG